MKGGKKGGVWGAAGRRKASHNNKTGEDPLEG